MTKVTLTKEVLADVDGKQLKFGYKTKSGKLYTLREIQRSTDQEFVREVESSEVGFHLKDGDLTDNVSLTIQDLIQLEQLGGDPEKLESKLKLHLSLFQKANPDDIGISTIISIRGMKFLVDNISMDIGSISIYDRPGSGGCTARIEATSI